MEGLKIFSEGAKKVPPPEFINEVNKPKDANVVTLRVDPESVAKRTTEALKNGEVLLTKPLRGGEHLNQTSFVSIMHKGETVGAIFKPKSGEVDRDISFKEAGEYYKHEVAACVLDKFFGFNLVPPTVIRSVNGEVGSAQEMVADAKTELESFGLDSFDDVELALNEARAKDTRKKMIEQYHAMLLLDLTMWATDRHKANFLIKDETIIAIDHGCSFKLPPSSGVRLVPRIWAIDPKDGDKFSSYTPLAHKFYMHIPLEIAPGAAAKFIEAASDKQKTAEMMKEISPLMEEGERQACLGRIKRIAKILKENKGTWPGGEKNALFYEGEDLVIG